MAGITGIFNKPKVETTESIQSPTAETETTVVTLDESSPQEREITSPTAETETTVVTINESSPEERETSESIPSVVTLDESSPEEGEITVIEGEISEATTEREISDTSPQNSSEKYQK